MPVRLKPIERQVVVVTGASSGNGLATARIAARRGAAVVLAARNGEALAQVRDAIVSQGGRAIAVAADVSSREAVEEIARRAIEAFGSFDSWVNNAGAGIYGTLAQVPVEDHRRVFDVNYFGTLHGSLVAAEHLRSRGGGAIVNVGSILGDRAIVEQGPYSATKHAIQALTDTLRMELEREGTGIAVTLVKPSGCGTPYPEHARNYMDAAPRIPQPLYHPDVVGDAIVFACAHPRRTLYIGSGAVFSSVAGQIAPRLTDVIMEAAGQRMQQHRQGSDDPAQRDNLYEPREDGRVCTDRPYAMRRTSLLVQAQKLPQPGLVGLAVAGGMVASARALARGRK